MVCRDTPTGYCMICRDVPTEYKEEGGIVYSDIVCGCYCWGPRGLRDLGRIAISFQGAGEH